MPETMSKPRGRESRAFTEPRKEGGARPPGGPGGAAEFHRDPPAGGACPAVRPSAQCPSAAPGTLPPPQRAAEPGEMEHRKPRGAPAWPSSGRERPGARRVSAGAWGGARRILCVCPRGGRAPGRRVLTSQPSSGPPQHRPRVRTTGCRQQRHGVRGEWGWSPEQAKPGRGEPSARHQT